MNQLVPLEIRVTAVHCVAKVTEVVPSMVSAADCTTVRELADPSTLFIVYGPTASEGLKSVRTTAPDVALAKTYRSVDTRVPETVTVRTGTSGPIGKYLAKIAPP